jgi:hypothetical protein
MRRITGLVVTLVAFSGCATPGGPGGGMHAAGGWGAAPRPPETAKVAKQVPGTVGAWGEPASATRDASVTQASAKSQASSVKAPAPGPDCCPPAEKPIIGFWANQGQVYAAGAIMPGMPPCPPPVALRSQVRFIGPAGGKIGWYVSAGADKDGKPVTTQYKLDIPGRYNFLQASVYRLKLSDVPGRPGLQLYPTLEVVPANPKTEAFLAHNPIPVEFTEEDFDQITAGNFITKVVYLPDAQHASPLVGGPEELVSTRLEPGVDPIAEAHRRGYILAVVRVGGIELESLNSPPLDGSGMFGAPKAPTASMMAPPMMMPMQGAASADASRMSR